MGKRLLVPLDGEKQSWAALEHVLEEHPDAALIGLCVIDPGGTGYTSAVGNVAAGEEWYARAKADAQAVLDEAEAVVAKHGGTFSTATVVGRPAAEIAGYADEHDVDGIVMGSHGRRGVSRILLGSVAETVVRQSSVPVTVVR